MGNRFKCSLAHGGSGGVEGNTLIVTCDSAFAGLTISASKSGTTYTQTCPSTSPYTVTFHGLEAGTWTISTILSGDTYSTSVTITDSTALLSYGFNWATWVTLGGLDPTDYSDLSDVFADEAAVRRLMLIHASADYLIDAVTGDVDAIDDFCSNDIAMKWIGLCDYVCDGLTAITGVETKFLASTYWERYLKDHVPTMTSNNAPYGTASISGSYQTGNAYKVFDGSDSTFYIGSSNATVTDFSFTYHFTTPICVKMLKIRPNSQGGSAGQITAYTISGSNGGSNFTSIQNKDNINLPADTDNFDEVENNDFYTDIRLTITQRGEGNHFYPSISTIQFYGRSLNVSVPVMTSNVLPYGEAFANEGLSPYQEYKAFDNDNSTRWTAQATTGYLGYKFPDKVCLKQIAVKSYLANGGSCLGDFAIEGSDDGTTFTPKETFTYSASTDNLEVFNLTTPVTYKAFRLNATTPPVTSQNWIYISTLQFYGVDYSEKEFEAGSTKKWIYDHGVVLEPISEAITTGGSITFNDDYIEINRNNGNANCSVATDSTVDLTGYSYLYAIVGIASGSALWHLIATSNRTAGTSSATAKADVNTASGDTKGGLDISSLNQALYLAVYAGNVAVQDVKELWVA